MLSAPPRPLSATHRWVMTSLWHLISEEGFAWDLYGLVPRPQGSHRAFQLLSARWQIRTRADFFRTLAVFEQQSAGPESTRKLVAMGTIVQLAAGALLLSDTEAWRLSLRIARHLQNLHSGWFSFAEAYLHQSQAHLSPEAMQRARAHLTDLFSATNSPFQTLPWSHPLSPDAPPPVTATRVTQVHSHAELQQALLSPHQTIRLAPGTYPGPYHFTGHRLEPAQDAPRGSVIIEGCGHTCDDGAIFNGLIFRTEAQRGLPTLTLHSGLISVRQVLFEGGRSALHLSPLTVARLDTVGIAGCSETAIELDDAHLFAQKLTISDCDLGLQGTQSQIWLERSRLTGFDRAAISLRGGQASLDRLHLSEAERWGITLTDGAHVELQDLEVSHSLIGLHATGGASIRARRSHFFDNRTANIELVDIKPDSQFTDCNVLGGTWAGLWLHPGHGLQWQGGQIGGSRQTCVMIEGGKDIRLERVAIGPSQAGGGLFLSDSARVSARQVYVSGAAMAGIEVRNAELRAKNLRIRGSQEGILVRDGATFKASQVDLSDLRGSGLWALQSQVWLQEAGIRHVRFGIVSGQNAIILVNGLIATATPVVAQVEGGRLALAGTLGFGQGVVRVRSGHLALRDLRDLELSGHDADIYLEHAQLRSEPCLKLSGRSKAVFVATPAAPDHCELSEDTEIIHDPYYVSDHPEPNFFQNQDAPLQFWGYLDHKRLLPLLVSRLIERHPLLRGIQPLSTPEGIRFEGPTHQLSRLATLLEHIYREHGALGILLAEILATHPEENPY